jgi:hypothetical protein
VDIHWTEGQASLRIGVDVVKKLEMDAVRSSETLVSTNQTTCCYNPEDHNINLHHCEYHKSYKLVIIINFL